MAAQPQEIQLRSYVKERWGESIIPEGMNLMDYPVTYDELEPFSRGSTRSRAFQAKAGQSQGKIQPGGNPFEGWRSSEYPMPRCRPPTMPPSFAMPPRPWATILPAPAGVASTAYVNPYGMQMAPCNFCGFCERFGCYQYSKSSPQTAILDALKAQAQLQLSHARGGAEDRKLGRWQDRHGRHLFDAAAQEEVFQPADLVILAAYQLNNVHFAAAVGHRRTL